MSEVKQTLVQTSSLMDRLGHEIERWKDDEEAVKVEIIQIINKK